ncbi:jerky protein homolog-like [Macrosteles quadrilineatus]|uniref:jerky protein homolog-like n=1 Tax=Macrosteles quadrilineatus TaxID=74068 RepID=UPI0023E21257|nr:jerky protein homolog-like [Macrosteles quadrilineatus]
MSCEKRKKLFVSVEEKLRAIKRIDAGETAKKVAFELGVGTSTVSDWRKNREQIEKWCTSQPSVSASKVRKTMRTGKHNEVEEALFLWHEHLRGKGVPVNGPMLQEKAKFFKREIEGDDGKFAASDGWLDRWKKRYGVRQLSVSGEALSGNKDAVPEFKTFLHNLLDEEGITGDQLYNCDETGLNYKMLPTKTLASKKEAAAPGYKKSKERVTVLACCNVTGNHKLRLTLIGKSKKPRAFKNLKKDEVLPLWYTNQQKAWMNSAIFKTWFFNEFVPSVEKHLAANNLPRKAILLLDNASTHPIANELKDEDIKAVFLPPNVTALCQPMDQGVLQALKLKYRHRLLSHIISAIDLDEDYITALKKIDVLDVIRWVAEGWEEIPPMTIVSSWKALLDHEGNKFTEIDGGEFKHDENHVETENVVSLLEKIPGCDEVNESDVLEWMNNDDEDEITDDDFIRMVSNDDEVVDEEDLPEPKPTIPHSEGFKMLDGALEYVSRLDGVSAADIMCLRKLRDMAAKQRAKTVKQATIKDFFKT